MVAATSGAKNRDNCVTAAWSATARCNSVLARRAAMANNTDTMAIEMILSISPPISICSEVMYST